MHSIYRPLDDLDQLVEQARLKSATTTTAATTAAATTETATKPSPDTKWPKWWNSVIVVRSKVKIKCFSHRNKWPFFSDTKKGVMKMPSMKEAYAKSTYWLALTISKYTETPDEQYQRHAHFVYSNHLNTRQVCYLKGPNMSGFRLLWFANGVLKTGQKLTVIWSKMFGIWMVGPIMWSSDLKK